MSRGLLVTKMFCASCGYQLELAYENDANGEKESLMCKDPAGAYMVQASVFIKPCSVCVGEARAVMHHIQDDCRRVLKAIEKDGNQ